VASSWAERLDQSEKQQQWDEGFQTVAEETAVFKSSIERHLAGVLTKQLSTQPLRLEGWRIM
jgi:hypothetical protein